MTISHSSETEPSPVPTDLPAPEHRGTEPDRPAIGLEGLRLGLACRLRSGMGRVRSDRRPLILALVVATLAASVTYTGLSSLSSGPAPTPGQAPAQAMAEVATRSGDDAYPPVDDDPGFDAVVIGEDHRTLALDRRSVLLPTEVGQQVEVVALTPTPQSVEASVVAESATVVAVDESVVVLRLSKAEARWAVEAGAVGTLALLGTG